MYRPFRTFTFTLIHSVAGYSRCHLGSSCIALKNNLSLTIDICKYAYGDAPPPSLEVRPPADAKWLRPLSTKLPK